MATDRTAMAVANTRPDQQCITHTWRHSDQHGSSTGRTTERTYGTRRRAKPSESGSGPQCASESRPARRALQDTCIPYDGAACTASCDNSFRSAGSRSASPKYARLTLNCIPGSNEQLNNTGLPLGLILQPLAKPADGEQSVPVLDFLEMSAHPGAGGAEHTLTLSWSSPTEETR